MNQEDDLGYRGFKLTRNDGASNDLLDSFEFQPPKDSDELFHALKVAFPRGKTHKERMREALIEFLIHEREIDRKIISDKPPSNDGVKNGSGSHTKKDHVPVPTSNRKRVPKDWDDMTVVWTSTDGLVKSQRPKRVMTEEQREAYKLRRVRGACVGCKRKKKKCNHNPASSPPFNTSCSDQCPESSGAASTTNEFVLVEAGKFMGRHNGDGSSLHRSEALAEPTVAEDLSSPTFSNFSTQFSSTQAHYVKQDIFDQTQAQTLQSIDSTASLNSSMLSENMASMDTAMRPNSILDKISFQPSPGNQISPAEASTDPWLSSTSTEDLRNRDTAARALDPIDSCVPHNKSSGQEMYSQGDNDWANWWHELYSWDSASLEPGLNFSEPVPPTLAEPAPSTVDSSIEESSAGPLQGHHYHPQGHCEPWCRRFEEACSADRTCNCGARSRQHSPEELLAQLKTTTEQEKKGVQAAFYNDKPRPTNKKRLPRFLSRFRRAGRQSEALTPGEGVTTQLLPSAITRLRAASKTVKEREVIAALPRSEPVLGQTSLERHLDPVEPVTGPELDTMIRESNGPKSFSSQHNFSRETIEQQAAVATLEPMKANLQGISIDESQLLLSRLDSLSKQSTDLDFRLDNNPQQIFDSVLSDPLWSYGEPEPEAPFLHNPENFREELSSHDPSLDPYLDSDVPVPAPELIELPSTLFDPDAGPFILSEGEESSPLPSSKNNANSPGFQASRRPDTPKYGLFESALSESIASSPTASNTQPGMSSLSSRNSENDLEIQARSQRQKVVEDRFDLDGIDSWQSKESLQTPIPQEETIQPFKKSAYGTPSKKIKTSFREVPIQAYSSSNSRSVQRASISPALNSVEQVAPGQSIPTSNRLASRRFSEKQSDVRSSQKGVASIRASPLPTKKESIESVEPDPEFESPVVRGSSDANNTISFAQPRYHPTAVVVRAPLEGKMTAQSVGAQPPVKHRGYGLLRSTDSFDRTASGPLRERNPQDRRAGSAIFRSKESAKKTERRPASMFSKIRSSATASVDGGVSTRTNATRPTQEINAPSSEEIDNALTMMTQNLEI